MAKMGRAEIAARLEKLEVLAARSPFAGERDAARAKIKSLRDMLGMPEPHVRSGRRVHYVDVGDTPNIRAAFKKAFQAAFDDIRETIREEKAAKAQKSESMLEQFNISMKVRLE